MKILIVNNLYPPYSRGGAEQVVVNEAIALRDAGHQVTVLTTAPFKGFGALWAHATDEEGITVIRFFPLNLFWYRNDHTHNARTRLVWYIGNFWNWHANGIFKRLIKRLKPDVVHLHNINGMSYRYPRMCDTLGVRCVFTVHAVHYAVPSGVIMRGQKLSSFFKPFAALLRYLLHTKATIVAPSQYLLDFYQLRGFFRGQNLAVIPNPVPSFPYSSPRIDDPRSADARSRLRADDGRSESEANGRRTSGLFRFLSVGQLESYKGVNLLIEAVRRLPPESKFQLDIVGDGTMAPELRKMREQKIRLRGKLNPDAVREVYRNSDVLVMPSLCEENAPMVIAEALTAGLPVVASRIGGIPEMIHDNENGMLFEPGNLEELVMQLRRCLEHPEVISAMNVRARESSKRYDVQTVTKQILALLGDA
jgi:glycosyltransferase involved in cell wall biosynthesis